MTPNRCETIHRPATISVTGTPQRLGTDAELFSTITFTGKKTSTSNNSASVFVKFTDASSAIGMEVKPGESQTFDCPGTKNMNAFQVWIVGTVGDVVDIMMAL